MNKNNPRMSIVALPEGMRLVLGCLFAAATMHLLAVQALADTFAFTPLAGNASTLDHTNGTGSNARFFNPSAVAVDGAGNIYVADGGDHTVRLVTTGGVVTTFAGTSGQGGSTDGPATSGALFLYPYAVAVDGSGNVYVADSGNQNIRKITSGGSVSTLAGTAGIAGSTDGTGVAALFDQPQGIAVDGTGNVYVSDTDNSTIRKITAAGVVTTLAGAAGQTGGSDGAGSSARFSYPLGLAVDTAGNIYVADYENSTIRKVTPGGSVSTLAGSAGNSGSVDGQGGSALFNHPNAVAVDGAGYVYVSDTSNQTVREISPGGSVSTLAGTAGIGGRADGTGAAARFFYPGGIASTSAGVVYVADTGNHTVRAMDSPGVVTTLAGSAGQQGDADGTGSQALFAYPYGVAVDGSGHLYVADSNNNTIRVVTTAGGSVSTLAGTGGIAGSADGAGGAASFNSPAGVAVDAGGNVYVADSNNDTIRKIAPGGSVTTLAGLAGSAGSTDGTGAGARFNSPKGVAVDAVGNVYVADSNNDTIRKITAGGLVTTLAGVAGQTGSGDGAGGSARFKSPYAVAVDGSGNVYVCDFQNATIRMINTSDTVSTVAGTAGVLGFRDGTGAAASFNQPYALTVDGSGNIFVADTYNRAIRKIAPGGSVTTLNGSQCRFYYPQGIAVDGSGTLYVADGDNQAILAGAVVTAPPSGTAVPSQTVTSGGNATFTITIAGSSTTFQWQTSTNAGTTWSNVSNGAAYSGATSAALTVIDPPISMSGDIYQVQLTNPAGTSVSGTATLTVNGVVTGGGSTGGGSTGSARLINISTRAQVGTGGNILIPGIVIGGSGTETLLIRADGPSLTALGVSGALAQPSLTVLSGQTVVATNTGWGTNPNAAQIASVAVQVGAFPIAAGSADSAVIVNLGPGAYTAEVSGVNGTSGVALVEVYEVSSTGTRLINIATRAQVGTGGNIMIAGFVIAGSGTEELLVRADGPSLTAFGVSGALAQPGLTVLSGQAAVAANTVWGTYSSPTQITSVAAQVGAFAFAPGSADSAVIVNLPAGSYTAEISGVNNSTGIALVEVYEDD
jgi:DNA-binding beta-propeller fold protein YncE